MDKELSVVILCYMAGARIRGLVERVRALLAENVGSWEIILVGNYLEGSPDDTPKIVREIAAADSSIRAVAMPKKGMMGWDAKTGLSIAEGRYICFIDGDEQMPVEDILRVYRKITSERLDLVLTYRKVRHDGPARRAISWAYNVVFKAFFPGLKIRDVNSKPKIFTREAYRGMRLTSDDWFLDAEMIISAGRSGLKIGQIPTEFYRCKYRRSFVKPAAVLEFAGNMIRARLGGPSK